MHACFSDDGPRKAPSYSSYKKEMFHKKKEKMTQLLKSVGHTSLKPEDQKKLIDQLKQIVTDFNA